MAKRKRKKVVEETITATTFTLEVRGLLTDAQRQEVVETMQMAAWCLQPGLPVRMVILEDNWRTGLKQIPFKSTP